MKKVFLLLIVCIMCIFAFGFVSDVANLSVEITIDNQKFYFDDIVYSNNIYDELRKNGKFDPKGRLLGLKKPISNSFKLDNIEEKLEYIYSQFLIPPKDATVVFNTQNPSKSIITPEFVGRKVNVDIIKKDIITALNNGKSLKKSYSSCDFYPVVTQQKILNALRLQTTFSTNIKESSANRKHNIALALRSFNGLMVAPNEEISFNQIVGERTEARGYKNAKVIFQGEFVDGVGGGVCQASTTIYNALIRSDFEATSVKNHSLKVGYISPSFDAMVSKYCDLKLKNTTDCVVFLKTYCTDENAVVEVYREKMDYQIDCKYQIISEGELPKEKIIIDTKGEYTDKLQGKDSVQLQISKPRLKTQGFLIYSKNGKVVRTKKIRTDTYKEQVGIVVKKSDYQSA